MADSWTVDFPLPGVVGMLVRVLLLQEKLVLQEKKDRERCISKIVRQTHGLVDLALGT